MSDVLAPRVCAASPHGEAELSLPTISVIIPTLNEADNLSHVLPFIPSYVSEVIIVDGGSTDGTVERARDLYRDVVVVMERRRGKGLALQRGFEAARGDVVVTLDADGSMNPGEIILFVSALIAGADFAKGSRFMQGGGTEDMEWYRKAGNWGLKTLVRLGFGGHYSDLCYGYNAFWAKSLKRLDVEVDGFEIETHLNIQALKHGLKIYEVPSFESPRINGHSNLNTFRDGWRVLCTIISEFVDHYRPASKRSVAAISGSSD